MNIYRLLAFVAFLWRVGSLFLPEVVAMLFAVATMLNSTAPLFVTAVESFCLKKLKISHVFQTLWFQCIQQHLINFSYCINNDRFHIFSTFDLISIFACILYSNIFANRREKYRYDAIKELTELLSNLNCCFYLCDIRFMHFYCLLTK